MSGAGAIVPAKSTPFRELMETYFPARSASTPNASDTAKKDFQQLRRRIDLIQKVITKLDSSSVQRMPLEREKTILQHRIIAMQAGIAIEHLKTVGGDQGLIDQLINQKKAATGVQALAFRDIIQAKTRKRETEPEEPRKKLKESTALVIFEPKAETLFTGSGDRIRKAEDSVEEIESASSRTMANSNRLQFEEGQPLKKQMTVAEFIKNSIKSTAFETSAGKLFLPHGNAAESRVLAKVNRDQRSKYVKLLGEKAEVTSDDILHEVQRQIIEDGPKLNKLDVGLGKPPVEGSLMIRKTNRAKKKAQDSREEQLDDERQAQRQKTLEHKRAAGVSEEQRESNALVAMEMESVREDEERKRGRRRPVAPPRDPAARELERLDFPDDAPPAEAKAAVAEPKRRGQFRKKAPARDKDAARAKERLPFPEDPAPAVQPIPMAQQQQAGLRVGGALPPGPQPAVVTPPPPQQPGAPPQAPQAPQAPAPIDQVRVEDPQGKLVEPRKEAGEAVAQDGAGAGGGGGGGGGLETESGAAGGETGGDGADGRDDLLSPDESKTLVRDEFNWRSEDAQYFTRASRGKIGYGQGDETNVQPIQPFGTTLHASPDEDRGESVFKQRDSRFEPFRGQHEIVREDKGKPKDSGEAGEEIMATALTPFAKVGGQVIWIPFYAKAVKTYFTAADFEDLVSNVTESQGKLKLKAPDPRVIQTMQKTVDDVRASLRPFEVFPLKVRHESLTTRYAEWLELRQIMKAVAKYQKSTSGMYNQAGLFSGNLREAVSKAIDDAVGMAGKKRKKTLGRGLEGSSATQTGPETRDSPAEFQAFNPFQVKERPLKKTRTTLPRFF